MGQEKADSSLLRLDCGDGVDLGLRMLLTSGRAGNHAEGSESKAAGPGNAIHPLGGHKCRPNTEFSGEPAALPSLVRCNSLFDGTAPNRTTSGFSSGPYYVRYSAHSATMQPTR